MNYLRQCDELKAKTDAFRPFPSETLKSLRKYYRVGLTYSSNALEGNSLTESETKIVLEDGLAVDGKPLHDVYEALGHAEAYDHIYKLADNRPIATADLLMLHQLFYRRIDTAQAGQFRKVRVFISGSHYALPPAEKLPGLTDGFVDWFNSNEHKMHPVEFAALAHQKFVFIHPFIDGNGRVSRLLMNLALIRSGYNIVIIPPILRREYIAGLEEAHINTQKFIDFIAVRAIETQRELLRLLGSDAVTLHGDGENDGVNKLLELVSRHPGSRVPALAAAMEKSRPTIERYLKDLKSEGKIEFRGAPKNGGYFAK